MISIEAELQLLGILSKEIDHYEEVLNGGQHFHDEGVGIHVAGHTLPLAPYLGYFNQYPVETRQAIFDKEVPAFLELIQSLVDTYPNIDFSEIILRAGELRDSYRPGYPTYIGDRETTEVEA